MSNGNYPNQDQGRGIQLPPFAPLIMDRNSLYSTSSSPIETQQQHPQPSSSSANKHKPKASIHGGSNTRLRVKKACDRCKRQKTKCDGEQPCLTCSRHGHKCEYTSVVPITTIVDKNKETNTI